MYSSISFLGYNREMKQEKKLLIVSDYFYPHWTGISKSLYYLLKSLQNSYSITVLTVAYDSSLKNEESLFNAKIIREPFLFSLSRAKYSFQLVLKSISLIKKVDIVIINSPCTNVLPVSLITKLFKKKLIIFHQGDLLLPKGFVNRLLEKIFDFSSLVSAVMANKLATYTQDYAQNSRILKNFLSKTSPILLPVLLAKPNLSCKKIEKLRVLKTEHKAIFGFAGRFVEEKGFDVLFDAISLIIREIPNAHFVFAGETNMKYEQFFEKNRAKYESVKPYLTMVGLLDSECLSAFYKYLDFLIVPSRSDCFNLVQAEAMLSGVPVIVSNIPGARVLVSKTKFGAVFETENSKSLADVLVRAYKNMDNIKKEQKNVEKILNNEEIIRNFKKFLEE